jgi:hypothetical protein
MLHSPLDLIWLRYVRFEEIDIMSLIRWCVVFLMCSSAVTAFVPLRTPAVVTLERFRTTQRSAKSKEEDLELTRQVIREYMEKSEDTTTATATVTEVSSAKASEE